MSCVMFENTVTFENITPWHCANGPTHWWRPWVLQYGGCLQVILSQAFEQVVIGRPLRG